jgi:hypothetical protein
MQEAGRREERHPSPPRMLDRTLGEKQAQQQAADKGGLLNSIFARGKNLLYNSPQEKMKGGVAVSGQKMSDEEREKEEKTKEYLAMTAVKMMEMLIDFGVLDESAFSEDKGAAWADMVSQEVQNIYIRCGQAEMERAALQEDIRKQEMYMQELEIKLTEAQHEEETQRKAAEGLAQKQQEMQHKLAEVDEELAETKALLANAEMAKAGAKETGSFGPVIGAGRCSTLLRQTMNADGRVCLAGNIVNALVNAPIRAGANPTMDRETTEALEQLAGFAQNEFAWTVDSRASLTGMEHKEKQALMQHIDEEFEGLKTRGELKAEKFHDWAYFFKMMRNILQRAPTQRQAMIDAAREAEERGGSATVFMKAYIDLINQDCAELPLTEKKKARMAVQDDGWILGRILNKLVPLSKRLQEQLAGDNLNFGAYDVGDAWTQSTTVLIYARRHFIERDVMTAIKELLGVIDNRKEALVETCHKRLRMFRLQLLESLVKWETRHRTIISRDTIVDVCMVEAYVQNAKPCPVIAEYWKIARQQSKYREELQDFQAMKKALPELTKEIEAFDELNGGHKNGQSKEAPKEKKAAGRGAGGAIDGRRMQDTREYAAPSMFGRGRGSARVERAPHAFVSQVVDDSKATVGFAQKKGSNPCTKCGFEHAVDAGCARNDNQRIRYDTSGPLVQRILESNDRDEKYKLCGEMIASLTKGAQNPHKRGPTRNDGKAHKAQQQPQQQQAGAAGKTNVDKEHAPKDIIQKCMANGLCIQEAVTGTCANKDCPYKHSGKKGDPIKTKEKKVNFNMTSFLTQVTDAAREESGAGPVAEMPVGMRFPFATLCFADLSGEQAEEAGVDGEVEDGTRIDIDPARDLLDPLEVSLQPEPEILSEEEVEAQLFAMTGETARERKRRFLKQLDWRAYFEEKQLKCILEAWKLKWEQVPGDLRPRHIAPRLPRIIMPVKTRYELGEVAKNAQRERTGLTAEQEKEKTEKKRMIRANQLAKRWRRLVSSLRRREEKRSSNLFWKKFANIITRREEKRACGKELERLTNIFQRRKTNTPERVETPKTMQDAPRGKRKIKKQRFVIPMREASFKPGEESGEKQFGTSGKGRFFTASFFFGRLEIQESKRQNQVIEQVDADWATRAKLTRRWTQILQKRRKVRVKNVQRAHRWGTEIRWMSRRNRPVYISPTTKLPTWRWFIVDDCLGYIKLTAKAGLFMLWGDPLLGKSGKAKGMVAYCWPERREVQSHHFPFYAKAPNYYVGLRNRRLEEQEGVILPRWDVTACLPADAVLQQIIRGMFEGCSEVQRTDKVTQLRQPLTADQQQTQQQMLQEFRTQLWQHLTEAEWQAKEQRLQELQMTQRIVREFQWKSQQRRQAAAFKAWQDYQNNDICEQLRLPWAPHPLSTVIKIEPYRRFKYCKGSGEYTAFEVTGNTAVYLASFTATAAPGIRLWLVDSGSSCFVTPFRDTMILPIRTELQMSGIGGAQSKMVSPLILSFLDADGKYAVLHFQGVFLLESLPIPLFATGPCEQQGWGFSLNASSPCATLPDGRCVPLFRDRVTGFHWIAERLKALPTIKGRRAMISRCLEHPRQAGIELEYVPSLDCSKQRTKLEDAESLPTQPLSQYKYEQQMTSPHSLGGGKQRADDALAAVNTRAQANEARRRQKEATLADDDNIQRESSEKEKMVTKVVKDVKEQRKCARSKVPKGFFEIDKIVTHREKEGETGYSIRWKGYEQAIGVEVTKEEVAEFIAKGGKILNAKFVYKRKYAIVNGVEQFLKWKSRMAVIGCAERQGWETVYSTFSPTVAFAAIRLLIALTVDEKYMVDSYDLSGAFLGTELRDRAVYVKLPADAGVHAGKILLLKKSVYGLKTSGKDFIEQLAEEILGFVTEATCPRTRKVTKHSFKRIPVDHCVFKLEDAQGRILLLLHYVDDLVLASTDHLLRDEFLKHINRCWNTTHEGRLARFLGINYVWSAGSCTCNAAAYIERIARRFEVTEMRLPDSPLDAGFEVTEADFEVVSTPEQISLYRSLIGSIGYAATTCRFDVSYSLSVLSRYLAKPNARLIEAAKRVIRYLLKTKHMGITWKITSEDKNTGFANTLFAATDASFAMCPLTRKSHAGYVIFLNHGPISYKSKLQNIVTLSSAEAEFVALSDVTCEVKYLRELSRGLGYPQREATLVFEDNRAAILVAQNECSASGRMRHVDVKFRFVAEAVKNKEIRVRYIPTDLNFADCFTKSLTPKKHAEAVKAILGDKDAYRLTVAKVDQEDEDQETENVMILDFTW